jgi:hypothetical protein
MACTSGLFLSYCQHLLPRQATSLAASAARDEQLLLFYCLHDSVESITLRIMERRDGVFDGRWLMGG